MNTLNDVAHWLIRIDYYGHPIVTGVCPSTNTEIKIAKALSRDYANVICEALNRMKEADAKV